MNSRTRLPVIVDTTLRDGIQMPGAALSFSDKAAVFDRLARLGITEAEIGCPAQGTRAIREIRDLSSRHPSINCSTWCRARTGDIDAAVVSGVRTIHISFPVSDRHMAITGFSRSSVLERCIHLIRHARDGAPRVTIGAQDATRAEPSFLHDFVATAHDTGAARVRIADTVGIATPTTIFRLIEELKNTQPAAALEYHGHNDFGLATATTLAAMEAGVDAVSVTAMGVGERAGNAALEEVLTAAVMLYGYETVLHLEELAEVCRITSGCFDLPVRPDKAVCGANAFRHESGIHCHGMLRDSLSYQPIHAESVGRTTIFSTGPQSGYSSIRAVRLLHQPAVPRSPETIQENHP